MATTDRLQGYNIGVAVKPPCTVASTANLTLSSTQVIDGIAVGSCERVLVRAQTDAKENGIYEAGEATWKRTADWDGARDAIPGSIVYVDRGTAFGRVFFAANSSSTAISIDIGSTGDEVTWSEVTPSLTDVSAGTVITDGTTTARALSARFAERVNVDDNGAKGDGTTDDTVAIQATLTNNNYVIGTPGKTYLISSKLTFNKVSGIIDFGGAILKLADNNQSVDTLLEVAGNSSMVVNLEIDGNKAGNATYTGRGEGLRVSGDYCTVYNVTGRNHPFLASNFPVSIYVTGDHCVIDNVRSFDSDVLAFRNWGDHNVWTNLYAKDYRLKGFIDDGGARTNGRLLVKNGYFESANVNVQQGILIDPGSGDLPWASIEYVTIKHTASTSPDAIKFDFVNNVYLKRALILHNSGVSSSLRIEADVDHITIDDCHLDGNINVDDVNLQSLRLKNGTSIGNQYSTQYSIQQVASGFVVIEAGCSFKNYSVGVMSVESADVKVDFRRCICEGTVATTRLVAVAFTEKDMIVGNWIVEDQDIVTGMKPSVAAEAEKWITNNSQTQLLVQRGNHGTGRSFGGILAIIPPGRGNQWNLGDICVAVNAGSTDIPAYRCSSQGARSAGAWAPTTAYSLGDLVTNDTPSRVYKCTQAGTSAGSGGPTGTGTGIVDNTCLWDFVNVEAEFAAYAVLA